MSPSCVPALQELGGLTGLRSYYSTALEAFDFLAPLLERLFTRIGDAGTVRPPQPISDGNVAMTVLLSWESHLAFSIKVQHAWTSLMPHSFTVLELRALWSH